MTRSHHKLTMKRLRFGQYKVPERYTHYLFRFPAKFHPPALRSLIARYTKCGETILDPFCGSGTLLVESLIAGRHAIGIDVDPVATFISRIKSTPIDPNVLQDILVSLSEHFDDYRRSESAYDRLKFADLSPNTLKRRRTELDIPGIPALTHWFRSYVAIDLAHIRNLISAVRAPPNVRAFFYGVFASIIRNASNADPVPVSGLEVTSYMRRLDKAGRYIDPFLLFERRAAREIRGMEQLWRAKHNVSIRVWTDSATHFAHRLRGDKVDVIITSPPYNTSVDYYRRHMLETYWLGLVADSTDRALLADRYIGRGSIPQRISPRAAQFESNYVNRLIGQSRVISALRERVVRHYCSSMQNVLTQCAKALAVGGKAVFVVGNAKWNGRRVNATRLLEQLAKPEFRLIDRLSYPVRNRYMSYSRHNAADVDHEYVVVLQKRNKTRRLSKQ